MRRVEEFLDTPKPKALSTLNADQVTDYLRRLSQRPDLADWQRCQTAETLRLLLVDLAQTPSRKRSRKGSMAGDFLHRSKHGKPSRNRTSLRTLNPAAPHSQGSITHDPCDAVLDPYRTVLPRLASSLSTSSAPTTESPQHWPLPLLDPLQWTDNPIRASTLRITAIPGHRRTRLKCRPRPPSIKGTRSCLRTRISRRIAGASIDSAVSIRS